MKDSAKSAGDSRDTSDDVRAAEVLVNRNRRQGLAVFNELFRSGRPPEPPLHGSYAGGLVAVDIAPGVTQVAELLASWWMPWKGKHLSADISRGDNIFGRRSRWLFRFLFPFYRGVKENDADTFRAFEFITSVDSGKDDPDLQVLKIDYDSRENPALTIRRIVDELVQLDDDVYLGKIHFRWWWGSWKMVGYFTLRPKR